MDIELTSTQADGSWTWRAAGAKVPKGVVEAGLLPAGAQVGDELRVEVNQELEGIVVVAVVPGRQKVDRRELLELVVSDEAFEPVTEQRVSRRRPSDGERRRDGGRNERKDRRDRKDRRRDDGPGGRGGDARSGRERRRDGDDRSRSDQQRRGRFTPPPEVPTRPKPKRLRPGRVHRNEVLSALPDAQRPIAEVALQGMPAVRQRIHEENQRLAADQKPTMPEDSVMKMAEELLPRLRLAEWLDRADAALVSVDEVDLRDLRSVLAAATDPIIARDERARSLTVELQQALARRQDTELELWYSDIDASLAVGRVIRALRLSSQPPKAGVPFPPDLAKRLSLSANAALVPTESAERWIALLEAAAFSPIRSLIEIRFRPDQVSDELRATIVRLGPALPQVAKAFEIEISGDAPMPKPLRTDPRGPRRDGGAAKPVRERRQNKSDGQKRPKTVKTPPNDAPATAEEAPVDAPAAVEEAPADLPDAVEEAPVDAPATVEEAPADLPAAVEEAPVDAPTAVEEAPADEAERGSSDDT